MIKTTLCLLLVAIAAQTQLYAQNSQEAISHCLAGKLKTHHSAAKPTVADPAEDDYDVKHLVFDISITDTSTYIEGNVKTTAQVVGSAMSDYVFELIPALVIDSAKVNGTILPVVTSGLVRTIHLPTPAAPGSFFTAQVYYHGTPPLITSIGGGMSHGLSSSGTHVVSTMSEPYASAFWWPAKQSLTDKVDSVDMRVRVPAGVVIGSNGLLAGVDNISSPGYSVYHWKTKYLIDYYLISVSAARYEQLSHYMHFTGSTDSMLIQNFILDTAIYLPAYRPVLDSIPGMINFFSSLFGRYPFWNEKYGIAISAAGGGLENQTLSSQNNASSSSLTAHELAHQWFGDNVTQKTWADLWLSEGFASFCTNLYIGYQNGAEAERSERVADIGSGIAYGGDCGRVIVTDTTSVDSIFTTNQYQKAATVLSTLRMLAPHDSLFFRTLKMYQQTYRHSTAGTMEFKAIAESVYGFNLDTFFNQWIYGRGYPIFSAKWNQVGNTVYLKLIQEQSCPSYTNRFNTPLEVRFRSGSIDTFVTFYNSSDTQTYTIEWDRTMTGIYLNWNAQVFMKVGTVTKDNSLTNVTSIYSGRTKVAPNPSRSNWEISALPDGTKLELMDMAGKVIWEGMSSKGVTTVPGAQLPSGTYILKLRNSETQTIKLVKW